MTFQDVPDTAVVEVITTNGELRNLQNNLYFRKAGGYDESDLQTLVDAISIFWADEMMDLVSEDCILGLSRCRGLANDPDFEAFATIGVASPGLIASPALPANVTIAIKFTTGHVGRSTRGRIYFAGLAESQVTADHVAAGTITSILSKFTTTMPGYIPAGWDHVVVSRYHDGAKRAHGVTYPITGYSVTDSLVDTQRRRLT